MGDWCALCWCLLFSLLFRHSCQFQSFGCPACHQARQYYSVAEIGIPGLLHFLYKSTTTRQFTMPLMEAPYIAKDQKRYACAGVACVCVCVCSVCVFECVWLVRLCVHACASRDVCIRAAILG